MILYLDVQRAAQAISMSPRWVRQQIRDGLPHLDSGGKLLIDPEEIKKWMVSRFTPKPVDLAEAYRQAEELVTGRRRGKRAAR